MQEDLLKLQLLLFDKLMNAITSVVKDYRPAKSMALKANLFTPLLIYLSKSESLVNSEAYYSEEKVVAALNLLSQVIDGEKAS